jgi:hypothetical protein
MVFSVHLQRSSVLGKLWTTSPHRGPAAVFVLPELFEGGLGIHELDFIFLDA